jgi:hypothetical protein
MKNKIIERIEREAGVPGLASILAERLAPTDLQSLLLEVYRLRSSQRRPADVLSSYTSDRFVHPASVSPERLLAWEQIAFAQLPEEFEALSLSPVCPLGTSSAVAGVDQNWAVSTSRNSEVVSDSTNVLALECALRRRELLHTNPKSTIPVHLVTSHRLLRAQRYEDPELASHFSTFALCSAGRDQGNLRFELSALGLHMRFYIKSLRAFLGAGLPLKISLTDFSAQGRFDMLEERLLEPLRAEFEPVDCSIDGQRASGRGYYLDLCFKIYAKPPSGQYLELVDGGAVDWTRRLLGNANERLVISGIGSERVCSAF